MSLKNIECKVFYTSGYSPLEIKKLKVRIQKPTTCRLLPGRQIVTREMRDDTNNMNRLQLAVRRERRSSTLSTWGPVTSLSTTHSFSYTMTWGWNWLRGERVTFGDGLGT